MNKMFILSFFLMAFIFLSAGLMWALNNEAPKTALLIIDIQNFYFPGGALPLVNPEEASLNASKLLLKFRQEKALAIHVGHNAKKGAEIHEHVKPQKGEKVIYKDEVNCFKNTDLLQYLKKHKVKRLVICGMQTHMCLEAATRAAHDYDFNCIVVHDSCATRALTFKDKTISAEDVHNSTLSTLSRTYAKVIDLETYLKEYH